MSGKPTKKYLDKEALWQEMHDYYESGIVTEKLGQMIIDISSNLGKAKNFSGYPFNEEMMADANFTMMKAVDKKKCNLWSQKKERLLQEHMINNFRFPDDLEVEPNERVVLFKNLEAKKEASVHIYVENEGEYFHTEDGPVSTYSKKSTQTFNLVYEPEYKQRMWSLVYLDPPVKQQKYDNDLVFDEDGEKIMVKSNLFGYFTNIATHEFQGKIKKEKANSKAISEFQEESYTQFLANNPDMAPQRIDNDTYESFLEE